MHYFHIWEQTMKWIEFPIWPLHTDTWEVGILLVVHLDYSSMT